MRVLMICDDHYHPGNVPEEGVASLKGFEFDVIKNCKDFKPDVISSYPVVVMTKSDQISPEDQSSWKSKEVQSAFIKYVESGGGLLVVHSGTVPGENTEALDKLIGSKFVFHPKDSEVTVESIKPHPVTEGVGMFCEVDEHYHLEILADDVDILMASYSAQQGSLDKQKEEPYTNTPAKVAPSAYVRTQGKGRVCVLTPGHTLTVWKNTHFQRLLNNSLNWCAGK